MGVCRLCSQRGPWSEPLVRDSMGQGALSPPPPPEAESISALPNGERKFVCTAYNRERTERKKWHTRGFFTLSCHLEDDDADDDNDDDDDESMSYIRPLVHL